MLKSFSNKNNKIFLPGELAAEQFSPPVQLNTPVLFLVFNRLDTTKQVFGAIRQAKPPRLYVAADGTRENKEGEADKVAAVRDYIMSNIDWNCEVKTLFREENLGCNYAVSDAITWFFEKEEQGIILEDDCLPNYDFFFYCEWALDTYRDDLRVWLISGNNFDCPSYLYNSNNVSFSALAQIWGWATWREKWGKFQNNPFYLMQESKQKVRKWPLSPMAKINKMHHIVHLQNGLDTWDFQWQITVLNNAGLCVSCSSNLISNIGDGEDATHTSKDARAHLSTSSIQGRLEYTEPKLNTRLTGWYETKMGLSSIRSFVNASIYKVKGKLKRFVKDVIASILFAGIKPIVIGSTGRSGSTMLSNAISESLVYHRFKVRPSLLIGRVLSRCARTYIDRVSDVASSRIPVNKTHGLLPATTPANVKFIFIYGDPLESALSAQTMMDLHGRIWIERHLYHLESLGSYIDLFEQDILNYEKLIQSWIKDPTDSVFYVRYEQAWDKLEDINSFLGFEVFLPERKERSHKLVPERINTELFRHLESLLRCECS